jgi:hypothetical protein
MKNEHSLDSLLQGTAEIEEFLHALLIAMAKRRHKPGEDVTKFASELDTSKNLLARSSGS